MQEVSNPPEYAKTTFFIPTPNYKLLNNDDLNDIRYLVTDYLENRGNKKFNDISYLKNDGYEFDDIYY